MAEERREKNGAHRSIVIKVGSNILTGGGDRICRPVLLDLVRQVADLHATGCHVIVVTSGAAAAGRERLGFPRKRKDVPFRQVLAAVGQGLLMQLYETYFDAYGVVVAQALLTKGDMTDRLRYLNARDTLLALMDQGVVPIVNENDVVAVGEIAFGDNDNLAAMVANLVDADLLIMLTDIAGLYTADPRQNPDATLVCEVAAVDDRIEAMAGRPGSERGAGGMITKVHAAKVATESGIRVVLCDGREHDVILKAAGDERLGTCFLPVADNVESRKRWILSGLVNVGEVVVDEGAARALEAGKSLLPVGVTAVRGDFERGDSICVRGPKGDRLACGLTSYSADDIRRIKGRRSDAIESILGYRYSEEVVQRDNLVLLDKE